MVHYVFLVMRLLAKHQSISQRIIAAIHCILSIGTLLNKIIAMLYRNMFIKHTSSMGHMTLVTWQITQTNITQWRNKLVWKYNQKENGGVTIYSVV